MDRASTISGGRTGSVYSIAGGARVSHERISASNSERASVFEAPSTRSTATKVARSLTAAGSMMASEASTSPLWPDGRLGR
jgi:hypothetical protein